jgi:hypothetical protein
MRLSLTLPASAVAVLEAGADGVMVFGRPVTTVDRDRRVLTFDRTATWAVCLAPTLRPQMRARLEALLGGGDYAFWRRARRRR